MKRYCISKENNTLLSKNICGAVTENIIIQNTREKINQMRAMGFK